MIMQEWSGQVWQTWFKSLVDLDWDVTEARECFGVRLPAGVELLIALDTADRDTVKLRAAVESLAEVMEAWSLPRMELHVKGLQAVYTRFEDFGKIMYEKGLDDLPDELRAKDQEGHVDYTAIGEYYVRSADLVHTGSDGRVFFFLRPGFEGQGR
jgi:hypothetical protein